MAFLCGWLTVQGRSCLVAYLWATEGSVSVTAGGCDARDMPIAQDAGMGAMSATEGEVMNAQTLGLDT